jgi:hypothetical protein
LPPFSFIAHFSQVRRSFSRLPRNFSLDFYIDENSRGGSAILSSAFLAKWTGRYFQIFGFSMFK